MGTASRPLAISIAIALIVAACGSSARPTPLPAPSPSTSAASSTDISVDPTVAPPAASALAPLPASATLPVRASAFEIGNRLALAPGSDGTLFVAIPRRGGSVLASLDTTGRPRPGWPIRIENTTACDHLLAVGDGSVRVVCDATNVPPPELDSPDVRAFAFDAVGRPIDGWPVQLRPAIAARVVNDDLLTLTDQPLTDTPEPGGISHEVWLTVVTGDGAMRVGTKVPMAETCCGDRWVIGPDGVAYGAIQDWGVTPEAPKSSKLVAVGIDGLRSGFPMPFRGSLSPPAFDAAGLLRLTVNEGSARMSRTLVVDSGGRVVGESSDSLGVSATDTCVGVEGVCEVPDAPLVGGDGPAYVVEAGFQSTVVAAVSRSGRAIDGWPYRSSAGSQVSGRCLGDDICEGGDIATPAIGPDGSLYLIHAARADSVGGHLVAIGPDGRLRPGWPVELRRPGAEFWSVVAGADGIAFALAIEPEAGGSASATVLAIDPDSSVRHTTTVVEP